MQKTRKTARRSCFFFENCQKQRFACKRRAKNAENSPSFVVFHRKSPKTAFRLQATSEKREKQPVARGFSSKIAKNSVSLASDGRKTGKTARRLCFFIKNCQKQRFACERRAENDENSPSLVVFHRKLPKTAFRLRATSEKTGKIVLRGIPKGRNSEKQCFGMPRRVVFCENEPSGSPEARKI